MAERKVWTSGKSSPSGVFVTVALQEGNVTGKSTVRTIRSPNGHPKSKEGALHAYAEAEAMLNDLIEVHADLERKVLEASSDE